MPVLVQWRSDVTTVVTDIPDAIPTTILAPSGQTIGRSEPVQVFLSTGTGPGVLDRKATLIEGPASSVEAMTACESEEGWTHAKAQPIPMVSPQ